MLLYNHQSPFHGSRYNFESYEPIDLKPEEKQQNNSFLEMAFANKILNKNNIVNIQNIQNISNYNTQDSMNKIQIFDIPLTNKKIYDKCNINNIYRFNNNNIINKNQSKFFSPNKINLIPNKIALGPINGNPENNEKSFNLGLKFNIQQYNYPPIQLQMNRCKSSKFLSYINQPNIVNKNANITSNKIMLPIKVRQLSPFNAHNNNITSNNNKNNNIIPIYRKIIFRRKKNIF